MPKRTQPHRECKKALRASHEHIVYINIIVKETQRKLCRVEVSEDTSIRWLKESIIDKNKNVMMELLKGEWYESTTLDHSGRISKKIMIEYDIKQKGE